MYRHAKYIIVNEISPILIDETLSHIDVGRYFNVTSAGSVSISAEGDKINVSVFGESLSLKLKSHPEDAHLIHRMFVDPFFG